MKKRNWGAEEKLAIVLEGLKEKRPVAEICREHETGSHADRADDAQSQGGNYLKNSTNHNHHFCFDKRGAVQVKLKPEDIDPVRN